jgi:hypothetical protein
MIAPHCAQNLEPPSEYFPQFAQSTGLGSGGWFTITRGAESCLTAQARAITHPTSVHPRKKLIANTELY